MDTDDFGERRSVCDGAVTLSTWLDQDYYWCFVVTMISREVHSGRYHQSRERAVERGVECLRERADLFARAIRELTAAAGDRGQERCQVTREDIERGRMLLAEQHDMWVKHPDVHHLLWERWAAAHASELLTLAEEARWRSVTELPSASDEFVIGWCEGERPTVIRYATGAGFGSIGAAHRKCTHWRPMPTVLPFDEPAGGVA